MTNTKFRKRALLSSVAMLLVALVALGSATFAWFSTRPNATATGLSAATTKSSSLQIKELVNDNWASDIVFDSNNYNPTNLNPVTFNGTAWKTASAAAYDSGYMGTEGLSTNQTIGNSSNLAAWSTVYLRYGETYVDDNTKSMDLTLNVALTTNSSSANAEKFIRVAVVPEAGSASGDDAVALGSNAIIFAPSLDGDWSADPTKWVAANKDATITATDSAATNVFGSSGTATLGNMIDGKVYRFKVYAYYEGTDPDCKDTNAGQTLNDFVFTFNVTPHA